MPSTKKTTKAVREALTASRDDRADASTFASNLAHASAKQLPGSFNGSLVTPRYTVELTTEGWQIKDNETGNIKAPAYGSEKEAGLEALNLNHPLPR